MKFKLDENLPFNLKRIIESKGNHQVDSVYHEKISGIDDRSLLEHYLKEKRILITLDQDFESEKLHPSDSHFGIIILKQKMQGKQAVSSLFASFLKNYDLDKVKRKKIVIEPKFIRILNFT